MGCGKLPSDDCSVVGMGCVPTGVLITGVDVNILVEVAVGVELIAMLGNPEHPNRVSVTTRLNIRLNAYVFIMCPSFIVEGS
jgi:hypothetical protein